MAELAPHFRPSSRRVRASSGERARIRGAVLRLGGLLGWQAREVIAFTEAVTGCEWRRCGQADFEAVLEEYRAILIVIKDKAARQAAQDGVREPGGMDRADHAAGI